VRVRGGEAQQAGRGGGVEAPGRAERAAQRLDRLLHRPLQPQRERGRLHSVRPAQEERVAEDVAQPLQRLADARGGEAELAGHRARLPATQQAEEHQEQGEVEAAEFGIAEVRHDANSLLLMTCGALWSGRAAEARTHFMRIAIIGTGSVGTALAQALAGGAHGVTLGTRDAARPEVRALAAATGAALAAPKAAAAEAEVVILALPWHAAETALAGLGDLGAGSWSTA
jgi:hypothetical protein